MDTWKTSCSLLAPGATWQVRTAAVSSGSEKTSWTFSKQKKRCFLPIGSIYHLYTTYIYCLLGGYICYMLPIPPWNREQSKQLTIDISTPLNCEAIWQEHLTFQSLPTDLKAEGHGRHPTTSVGWWTSPQFFQYLFFNMSKNMLNPQHSEIYLSYIHILLFSTQLNYPVFFGLPKHLLSICAIFGRNLVFCDLIHVKWFWSKSQGICAENRINSNSISPHMAFVNYPLWFYGFCKKGPPSYKVVITPANPI